MTVVNTMVVDEAFVAKLKYLSQECKDAASDLDARLHQIEQQNLARSLSASSAATQSTLPLQQQQQQQESSSNTPIQSVFEAVIDTLGSVRLVDAEVALETPHQTTLSRTSRSASSVSSAKNASRKSSQMSERQASQAHEEEATTIQQRQISASSHSSSTSSQKEEIITRDVSATEAQTPLQTPLVAPQTTTTTTTEAAPATTITRTWSATAAPSTATWTGRRIISREVLPATVIGTHVAGTSTKDIQAIMPSVQEAPLTTTTTTTTSPTNHYTAQLVQAVENVKPEQMMFSKTWTPVTTVTTTTQQPPVMAPATSERNASTYNPLNAADVVSQLERSVSSTSQVTSTVKTETEASFLEEVEIASRGVSREPTLKSARTGYSVISSTRPSRVVEVKRSAACCC